MQPTPIKVNPDVKGTSLDPQSRLNYGKVYNIEHNVKVKNFGSLSPEYLKALLDQFVAVFTSKIPRTVGPAPASADHEKKPDMTGAGPKDKRQFLGTEHRDAVARHSRNAAASGRATAANNSSGRRGQQQTVEGEESDDEEEEDEDDGGDDGNAVEEESTDEDDDDDEEGDDQDEDEDEDDDGHDNKR